MISNKIVIAADELSNAWEKYRLAIYDCLLPIENKSDFYQAIEYAHAELDKWGDAKLALAELPGNWEIGE